MDDGKFFKFSRNVFQFVRLWSKNSEKSRTFRARFIRYSVVYFICGIMPIVSASDIIAAARTEDLSVALTKSLYGIAYIMCGYKVFAAAHNSEEIISCIEQLEVMAQKFEDRTDVKECLKSYNKMIKIGSVSMNLCGMFFLVAPIVGREFPYNPHIPFLNFNISPNYEIMYAYQAVAVVAAYNVMLAFDTLFCGLLSLCGGVWKSITREISHLDISTHDHKSAEDSIKKVIEKIIETSSIIHQISDIFSFTTIASIFCDCSLMAIGLLMVSFLPVNDLTWYTMMCFITVETFQLWIYSYFGQMVVNEKQLLQTELYCTKWYNGSKNFKTMLFLTLFEAQKDRYIQAGNVLPLSLNTFTEVLKKTYGFYAFFRQVTVERH